MIQVNVHGMILYLKRRININSNLTSIINLKSGVGLYLCFIYADMLVCITPYIYLRFTCSF